MRPGPIPNPEVKPVFAAVLLTCVSGWEAAVLALDLIHIFKEDAATKRVKFVKVSFTANTYYFLIFVGKKLGINTWMDLEIYTITNLTSS